MKRRFRDVILHTDRSMSTSITNWHDANGDYTHRNALYNELGYRAYDALMKENKSFTQ